MTKPCVFGYSDVHPSHRDDYDAGYDQTFTFARHAEPDELDDEIFMLRERLTSGDVRDGVFWFLHGALAAIASATGECPHCRGKEKCDVPTEAA